MKKKKAPTKKEQEHSNEPTLKFLSDKNLSVVETKTDEKEALKEFLERYLRHEF